MLEEECFQVPLPMLLTGINDVFNESRRSVQWRHSWDQGRHAWSFVILSSCCCCWAERVFSEWTGAPIFWRLQTFQRFGNRVFSGWGWMNASMLHALPFSIHVTLFHQQIHILTSWVMVKETKNDPLLSFTGRHWRKRWNEEVSKYLYSAPAWSGHLSLLHSEFFSLYFSWT